MGRFGGAMGWAGLGELSPRHAFTLGMKDAAVVERDKPCPPRELLKGPFAETGTDTPASATSEQTPGDILRAGPALPSEPACAHKGSLFSCIYGMV